jgi:hypothetical protein
MRLALGIICALVVPSAYADVGIGISAKTDGATVYIPVTVRRFMLEPYVRATDQESETLSTTGTTFALTTKSTSELKASAVGVGIFRLVPLADRLTLYYGGRLGRIDQHSKSFSALGLNTGPLLPQSTQSSKVEGTEIIPAIGFHYSIVERLSIGGEIGVTHQNVDVDSISRSPSGLTTQTSRGAISMNQTRADIILRFFF